MIFNSLAAKKVYKRNFPTFNSLMDKGSQIIISSDEAPMKLDRIQERIKSRLAGGLVVDIETPDLELKKKL